jgi:predicted NAD/FAD-dependent oxidoreductase
MNALAKHLSADLDVHTGTHVAEMLRRDDVWKLTDRKGRALGEFDAVLVNCPPQQALTLLAEQTELCRDVESVHMNPCWSLMVATEGLTDSGFDGAFVDEGPISWIAHDGAKPGRSEPGKVTTWTVHATSSWSEQHLDSDPADVRRELLSAFHHLFGSDSPVHEIEPVHCDSHLWRFAIPENALPEECLWDADASVGVCGDWCGPARIEGAFLSGISLAGTLLRHVTIDRTAYRPNAKLVQPSLI